MNICWLETWPKAKGQDLHSKRSSHDLFNMEEYRLEIQFKALQANIGYLLHPVIKQHDRMRIADVGTGTG